MSHIKLKEPNTGVEKSFEFGHAQRMLKYQVDKNVPKESRWKLIKTEKSKVDDNNSGKHKPSTKGKQE